VTIEVPGVEKEAETGGGNLLIRGRARRLNRVRRNSNHLDSVEERPFSGPRKANGINAGFKACEYQEN
jgi:hypothetical protein